MTATPTVSGRPRVLELTRAALEAEAIDQNLFASEEARGYVRGVRDALAYALGWADRPPMLPQYVAGHIAQNVEEALIGVTPDPDEERL